MIPSLAPGSVRILPEGTTDPVAVDRVRTLLDLLDGTSRDEVDREVERTSIELATLQTRLGQLHRLSEFLRGGPIATATPQKAPVSEPEVRAGVDFELVRNSREPVKAHLKAAFAGKRVVDIAKDLSLPVEIVAEVVCTTPGMIREDGGFYVYRG